MVTEGEQPLMAWEGLNKVDMEQEREGEMATQTL